MKPVHPLADPARAIPVFAGERCDAIRAAQDALLSEQRRLERLGFEEPLARCHEQRRYWAFVGALFELPEHPVHLPATESFAWPARDRR
jgi:hypothetical protein